MLAFIGFSWIAALLIIFAVPDSFAAFTEPLHHICVSRCPVGAQTELYSAIVCGSKLETWTLRNTFVRTGLIHLLVVSGSHLVFLEEFLLKITPNRKFPRATLAISFLLLLLFSLVTLLQPPVLRSFLSWLATRISGHYQLNWSRLSILTGAGAATLMFCRTKADVLSLGLSWTAAVALHFASTMRKRKLKSISDKLIDSLRTHVTAYSLLWVPLVSITVPHPASILCNLVLAPVVGAILFPVSMLALIVPALSSWTDLLWDWSLFLIESISSQLSAPVPGAAIPASWTIVYIGLLTIALFWNERART
jgi:ComEC/Rec2-related protein